MFVTAPKEYCQILIVKYCYAVSVCSYFIYVIFIYAWQSFCTFMNNLLNQRQRYTRYMTEQTVPKQERQRKIQKLTF